FSCFTAPPPIQLYTLSLHDALPILQHWRLSLPRFLLQVCLRAIRLGRSSSSVATASRRTTPAPRSCSGVWRLRRLQRRFARRSPDRKSTRLNSSHLVISYAVFCLKK